MSDIETIWTVSIIAIVATVILCVVLRKEKRPTTVTNYKGGPLNLQDFNRLFVEANQALTKGNTEGLKAGLGLFIEALAVAGDYAEELVPAIVSLRCALSHHDRADTKGPWNWDLSGYGVFSWKNDLYDRDEALQKAWPHIEVINNGLRSRGLGWIY